MSNFQGIKPEILTLLDINKFNNSKSFYDEHKEELKQGARVPLSKLVLDVADKMYDIDENIYIEPSRMVCRIRRDTRFTKDKHLYRNNLWVMFRHKKSLGECTPAFWFEYTPVNYSYGVGYYICTPKFMEMFRESLRENPLEFLQMYLNLTDRGYILYGDTYKREKEGCPFEELKPVYNLKEIGFIKYQTDITALFDKSLADEFNRAVDDMREMYEYLLKLHLKYTAQRGEKNEQGL